jgi:hypothetical protein
MNRIITTKSAFAKINNKRRSGFGKKILYCKIKDDEGMPEM